MKKPFSKKFRSSMVAKMCGPDARSATALARETGMAQSTLSRWLLAAGASVETMRKPSISPSTTPKRPQDWTAEERLALVVAAAPLNDDELGELLRGAGVHVPQLKEWRRVALEALDDGHKKYRGKRSPEARMIRSLESELHRKEKALAEVAALLVLKKKVQHLWGDEDEPTGERNDR